MKVYIGPYKDDEDQEVKVEIDNYDTWSMDYTLAHIVIPMLKQLKETKHGAPLVDMEDRPEHLQTTELDEYKTDIYHFEAWDWVMGEMIFAFESKFDDWEDRFSTGEIDRISVPCDKDGNDLPEDASDDEIKYHRWDEGPNHTYKVDWDSRKAYQERIHNGFRLFGKYYESLWD
jgi:hypothetical protein